MFRRLGASIRKWMYGRYGSDQLNMLLLVLAVILSLTNTILTYALRTQHGSTATSSHRSCHC